MLKIPTKWLLKFVIIGFLPLLMGCVREIEVVFHPEIIVDGRPDEWQDIKVIDLNKRAYQSGSFKGLSDLRAEIRLAWNADGFFVACHVEDDHLIGVTDSTGKTWGDHLTVEVEIPDASGEGLAATYKVMVGPHNTTGTLWIEYSAPRNVLSEEIEAGVTESRDEVFYEINFPWSAITPAHPFQKPGFGLTIEVVDESDDPQKSNFKRIRWQTLHRPGNTNPPLVFTTEDQEEEVIVVSMVEPLYRKDMPVELVVGFTGKGTQSAEMKIWEETVCIHEQPVRLTRNEITRVSIPPEIFYDHQGVFTAQLQTSVGKYTSAPFVVSQYVDSLIVLYTANTLGYLGPCDCSALSQGGLARRATAVKEIQTREGEILLLSAGDFSEQSGRHQLLKSRFVLRALKSMGYQVIALGRRDLAIWGQELLNAKEIDTYFLATNTYYHNAAIGMPLYQGEVKKVQVAVSSFVQAPDTDTWRFVDPEKIYGKIMENVSPPMISIGLLSGSMDYAEKLATELSDVQLWILASLDQERRPQILNHGAILVVAGGEGKSLGYLKLKLDRERRIVGYSYQKVVLDDRLTDDPDMLALYDEYHGTIGRERENKTMVTGSLGSEDGP